MDRRNGYKRKVDGQMDKNSIEGKGIVEKLRKDILFSRK